MLPQRLFCTMTGIFRLLRSILSVTKDAEHDAAARSKSSYCCRPLTLIPRAGPDGPPVDAVFVSIRSLKPVNIGPLLSFLFKCRRETTQWKANEVRFISC